MIARKNRKRKKGLLLICLAITITIFLAGLWPFDFYPENEVSWLNGQNGIHFGRWGIAYSTEPIYGPLSAIQPGSPFSIELVIRPTGKMNIPFSRILTLYGGGNRQFFFLTQRKSQLILRAALQGKDIRRDFREISVRDIQRKNVTLFITVTSNKGNTIIYVDGRMMNETNDFPILPADSNASGILLLGNSPTGKSPWTGDLLFLAIYDRELSAEEVMKHFRDRNGTPTWLPGNTPTLLYRFDERTGSTSRNHGIDRNDIFFPATYHVFQKTVLRPPWQEEFFRRYLIRDVFINVLGFLPLGFFYAAWLRKENGLPSKSDLLLVATLGSGISLIIELLQIYLPSRTSSLSDLICNILGTMLGAYLFRWSLLLLGLEKRTN